MEVEVAPVEPWHVDDLLAGVRQADVAEFWAAAHLTPAEGLAQSLRFANEAWAGLHRGQVLCIFGVSGGSMLVPDGVPWMLAHRRLDRHARAFLRDCRPAVAAMLDRYRHLSNYVDARNICAIRWLRWLGFEIHPAVPHGVDGLPFHYFEMSR